MNISYNIELEKLSKPNQNHNPQQIIKGKDKGKEDANTKTTRDVLLKRKSTPSA